ncbi:MAG: hypothetical protein U0X20_23690 [Caldilineaceae bacterium]
MTNTDTTTTTPIAPITPTTHEVGSLARLQGMLAALKAAMEEAAAELREPLFTEFVEEASGELIPAETTDDRAFSVYDNLASAIMAALVEHDDGLGDIVQYLAYLRSEHDKESGRQRQPNVQRVVAVPVLGYIDATTDATRVIWTVQPEPVQVNRNGAA